MSTTSEIQQDLEYIQRKYDLDTIMLAGNRYYKLGDNTYVETVVAITQTPAVDMYTALVQTLTSMARSDPRFWRNFFRGCRQAYESQKMSDAKMD